MKIAPVVITQQPNGKMSIHILSPWEPMYWVKVIKWRWWLRRIHFRDAWIAFAGNAKGKVRGK